jgi:hypothetical protein
MLDVTAAQRLGLLLASQLFLTCKRCGVLEIAALLVTVVVAHGFTSEW